MPRLHAAVIDPAARSTKRPVQNPMRRVRPAGEDHGVVRRCTGCLPPPMDGFYSLCAIMPGLASSEHIIVKTQSAWLLFALGSAAFGGATAILAKVGIAGIDSNLATFYRTLVVLVFAGLIVSAQGAWSELGIISVRSWLFLALSGVATAASWLCYYRALQLAPASRVAPVDKLSLVVAIALGVLVLGEPVNAKFLIGAALVVAGIFVIALS